MKQTYRDLSAHELAALRAFAQAHGRKWKDELANVYWYNARLWRDGPDEQMGTVLHGLRNEFGAGWLFDVLKLPRLDLTLTRQLLPDRNDLKPVGR